MVEDARVPTVWGQLSETLYLQDSPAAEVRLSEPASFSFGRLQNREGLPEITRPVVGERGYLVVVQLEPVAYIEQYLGNKKVSSGSYPVGGVSAIDLQEEPAVLLPSPFNALVLYVTQAALDKIAYAHRVPRVEQLVWPQGAFDPVVHHLAQTLVPSLERPDRATKIFLDYVLHALNCHFVWSYGGVRRSAPQFRGGLSSLQMRIAAELLEAHLDGNIALRQVAEACNLSVSHFARAFKQSFHTPPYRWLMERRVARAQDLMTNSRLSLAEIAVRCGFADQSALNRSFKRMHSVSPGLWRRGTTRVRNGS